MTLTIIEIEDSLTHLAEVDYDPELFGTQFIEAMGANPTTIRQIRSGKTNTEIDGAILWRQKAHILAVSSGRVDEALSTLQASAATADRKKNPRFLIATDGEYISAIDLKRRETSQISYADLANSFSFFLPLAGLERFEAAEENPIDIKASAKLAKLHDAILAVNPAWKGPAYEHDLHVLMTRLIFCFFAEDVGILPDSIFSQLMTEKGGKNGETSSITLESIFEALASKSNERGSLQQWAESLPYANGGLFLKRHNIPDLTGLPHKILLDACRLDWASINPDIFGSMVQSVINPEDRHELGLHYTSVSNIKKVIDPLFMNSLRGQASRIIHRIDRSGQIGFSGPLEGIDDIVSSSRKSDVSRVIRELYEFLMRLSRIEVMDPAAGSGNFLVVAYREMRRFEIRIWQIIQALEGRSQGLFSFETSVRLSQFSGIEIADFAAETAKLALFITQQQMNIEAANIFSLDQDTLPLPQGANITHANALRINWSEVCRPPIGNGELYIVGNPPFLGSTYQSKEQKEDMRIVFDGHIQSYKSLDFVSAFFFKAAKFIEGRNAQVALVSTNSICQGQSVPVLWPSLLDGGMEISFAHRSFRWSNSAKRNAVVTCVIVGLRNTQDAQKTLFQDGVGREASNINAYLLDARDIVVEKETSSIFGLPVMYFGNQPNDGGYLILSPEERDFLLQTHPESARFIRRLMGSQEIIKGIVRYCLWIKDSDLTEALNIPEISRRVSAVETKRLASKREATRHISNIGHKFGVISGDPISHSILVPIHTGENREYLLVDIFDTDVVSSNANMVLYDAPEWCLSILASKMHRAWIETICGTLGTSLRYSNTLGWNTFPVPDFTDDEKAELTECADGILAARDAHPGSTIADLYDPEKMPADLRAAHERNDETLERIYIGRRFRDDAERLEHLFSLYAKKKSEPRRKPRRYSNATVVAPERQKERATA